MKNKPFVSVQVINWNGRKFLKDCFDSLIKQDYPNFELVLVDNGSNDDSISLVQELYKKQIYSGKLRIYSLDKNKGFAEGYNRSYECTEAEYVLLINNDTICSDHQLISKMVAKAESDKLIANVGASIYPIGTDLSKVKPERTGTLSMAMTNTFHSIGKNKVFYVSGCCCLIRKKLVDKPFDKDYFAYCEDVYMGWNNILRGYKNVQVTDAKLLHYGSATTGTGSPFVRYYAERNRMLNCLLFYDTKTLIKVIPLLLVYSFTAGLFFLQRPKVFWAFLKGHAWIWTHIPTILSKRREIQSKRKVDDSEIIKLLASDIFLMEAKTTSFYESLKKSKVLNIVAYSTRIMNNVSKRYCSLVGLKTIDIKNNK